MTRHLQPDLHVAPHGLPLAPHRPSRLCPCGPSECVELLGGTEGRVVYVHRDLAPVVAHPVDVPEPAA